MGRREYNVSLAFNPFFKFLNALVNFYIVRTFAIFSCIKNEHFNFPILWVVFLFNYR